MLNVLRRWIFWLWAVFCFSFDDFMHCIEINAVYFILIATTLTRFSFSNRLANIVFFFLLLLFLFCRNSDHKIHSIFAYGCWCWMNFCTKRAMCSTNWQWCSAFGRIVEKSKSTGLASANKKKMWQSIEILSFVCKLFNSHIWFQHHPIPFVRNEMQCK